MPSTAVARASGEPGAGQARRTQLERRTDAELALLRAAVRLFAAKGIDRTSLAEIGEEAGYSRGLVNHHFGSKAALVEQLAEASQRHFVSGLSSLEETGAAEALVAIACAYLATVSEASDEVRAFFVMWGAAIPDDAMLRSIFVGEDRRFRSGIEQLVAAGRKEGTIQSDVDEAGFAVAFVGMLRGAAAQYLVDREGVDLEAARIACESLVRSVGAPLPPAPER